MIRRIWRSYLAECARATRLRQTWMGPALLLVAVVSALWVHPVKHDNVSDYGYVAYAVPATLNMLGFLLVLIFSASLASTEMADGSLRQFLVRPLRRHEILFGKLLLAFSYVLLLACVCCGAAWGIAALFGELHGVTYGGEMIFTSREMAHAFTGGLLLSLAPHFAGASLGLLLSVLSRNPTVSIMGAIGLWILIDIAKYPLGVEKLVFTTWLEAPWSVFVERCDAIHAAWTPMAYYCIGTSMAVCIASFILSALVFSRRDFGA